MSIYIYIHYYFHYSYRYHHYYDYLQARVVHLQQGHVRPRKLRQEEVVDLARLLRALAPLLHDRNVCNPPINIYSI